MGVALPLGGKNQSEEVEVGRFVGATNLDLADEALGEAELEADQGEEGTERDDEARLAGSLHNEAVDITDAERDHQ